MVLGFVQQTIADLIGVEKAKEISLEFSFAEDRRMNEESFYLLLEQIEDEMDIELIDCAWRFETVKQLVDYINRRI